MYMSVLDSTKSHSLLLDVCPLVFIVKISYHNTWSYFKKIMSRFWMFDISQLKHLCQVFLLEISPYPYPLAKKGLFLRLRVNKDRTYTL